MTEQTEIRYGFIKPGLDAHTLGLNAAAELLKECGYDVVVAGEGVEQAMSDYRHEKQRRKVADWVRDAGIQRLGISYRLDQTDAVNMVGYLLEELKKDRMLKHQGGPLDLIFFGGLPATCQAVEKEFGGLVKTFMGGESDRQSLLSMGVPEERIPADITEHSKYDDFLLEFGKDIIDGGRYKTYKPVDRSGYPDFGTDRDTVVKRIDSNRQASFSPLMRAHVGPYSADLSRKESVKEFRNWAEALARTGYLDILSIGSSQLTQSNFGEDWGDRTNGGGVPINSPAEYRMIWEAARPMLVRTYAGTKNIPELAKMHEETINISWHALSLWWFNRLDERGPYDLYTSLKQHIETIRYIASTNKPFEANVSHHFAFRGADDVTYIVSSYLTAKLAKKLGIRTFVLQNMLNTPRSTWGIQDLAKSRALLKLFKGLEDKNFRVLLQPRAGLDYFKPDLYEAKIQLAAVSALMDDIDPHDESSPPIIHVVSYSEASHLATPDVIDESIQITQYALQQYRALRRAGKITDMSGDPEVARRSEELYEAASEIIEAIERLIEDPYSSEGFYRIFAAGFLPVPYLWGDVEEFPHAKNWKTRPIKGSVKVVDETGKALSSAEIIAIAEKNLKDAEHNLNQRMRKIKS